MGFCFESADGNYGFPNLDQKFKPEQVYAGLPYRGISRYPATLRPTAGPGEVDHRAT